MMLVEAEDQFNEADIKLRRSKERHDRAEKNLQLQKQYLRKQSWPTEVGKEKCSVVTHDMFDDMI